jgi:hypothetical protein
LFQSGFLGSIRLFEDRFMSLLTNDTNIDYKEPEGFAKARRRLLAIGSKAPTFGVKGTAGMTDTEQSAQDLLANYANNQSPEVTNALASLKETGQYQNIMDVPEYAALYKTGQGNMNTQLNRLGRSMQIQGNNNSGAGADTMATRVGDLNTQLMGSMAPYAAQERERRYQAPLTAAALASSDTQSRLGAVKEYGALPRQLEQLSLDADYMSQYLNATAPYQYQVPALAAVGNIKGDTVVSGGGMSDYGMLLQAGATIAGGYLAGRGGGGGGGEVQGTHVP